jgi:hypothetical protein
MRVELIPGVSLAFFAATAFSGLLTMPPLSTALYAISCILLPAA